MGPTEAHGRPRTGASGRLIDRLWDERDALAATLTAAAGPMRELAERNFAILDDVIAR